MTDKPNAWGDMARERDTLVAALVAYKDFQEALNRYENSSYKGDSLKEVNSTKGKMDEMLFIAQPIIDKYRR